MSARSEATREGIDDFRRLILAWGRLNFREFPWRAEAGSFEMLIAEILLRRTRAERVVSVFRSLLDQWPSAEAMGNAPVPEVAEVIETLGLRSRASVIVSAAQQLAVDPDVAKDPDSLMGLRGIGLYAAHAVPIFAHGRNLPLVDYGIARVLRRFFGLDGHRPARNDKRLWELADRMAALGDAPAIWYGVLDLAAAPCLPRRPMCLDCPLRDGCIYASRNGVVTV